MSLGIPPVITLMLRPSHTAGRSASAAPTYCRVWYIYAVYTNALGHVCGVQEAIWGRNITIFVAAGVVLRLPRMPARADVSRMSKNPECCCVTIGCGRDETFLRMRTHNKFPVRMHTRTRMRSKRSHSSLYNQQWTNKAGQSTPGEKSSC